VTVYVLHLDPPYKHARHYIGYTPDATAERRVNEHLSCLSKGNPLVRAAVEAGCEVTLAHEYPGAGRDFERWLKARRDTARWCKCCGLNEVPVPTPERMTARFLAKKPDPESYERSDGGVV
jgi:hypothetical protein